MLDLFQFILDMLLFFFNPCLKSADTNIITFSIFSARAPGLTTHLGHHGARQSQIVFGDPRFTGGICMHMPFQGLLGIETGQNTHKDYNIYCFFSDRFFSKWNPISTCLVALSKKFSPKSFRRSALQGAPFRVPFVPPAAGRQLSEALAAKLAEIDLEACPLPSSETPHVAGKLRWLGWGLK